MKVIVIAEAGVNHNGDIELAKKLIDVASQAKVDFVKFQTFKAEKVISKFAAKANYQQVTTGLEESQLEMVKKLELSDSDHFTLVDYCKQRNVSFLSTPFDLESIDLLKALNVKIGKIPSGEITNLPYLEKMGKTFGTIIMSTGMAEMSEIAEAIRVLNNTGRANSDITVLHCNTEYPTPMVDVNLKAMLAISEKFKVNIGYSDHTLGIEIPIAAVAMGATIIEKHFTLNKGMEGPDHQASLEPLELRAMVAAIRNIELAIGSGIKTASPSEIGNRIIARKSIVAARLIEEGEIFSEINITVKRPGTGISPMLWYSILGERAKRKFEEDELIGL